MAAVSSRPTSVAQTRPKPSPAASTASIHSSDNGKYSVPPSSNGSIAKDTPPDELTASSESITTGAAAKKPNLSTRLTRMFSSKNTAADAAYAREAVVNFERENDAANAARRESATTPPNGLSKADVPKRGRSGSQSLVKATQPGDEAKTTEGASEKKELAPCGPGRRFVIKEDGMHEHYLKTDRRQEKLSDLFKNMLMGRKKEDGGNEHQLSLMSSWVDQEPHMVAGLCGSGPYIAPEEYTDNEFDPRAVDVWACGVIYMAMRTGRHLWRLAQKEEDEFYQKYLEGRRDEDGYGPIETLHRVSPSLASTAGKGKANKVQARCRNVIYSILDPNPSRRITASQVLKSEWGREIKLCKAGEEGF
ncbi:hypothetical protein FH972_024908 [Carpinus fangiana]|uniref:non-specific serine/threonine protein kinase n=1 Tax=Carpinus fangiana TaxID=176857 RepID=A0A5N6L0D9_9ROSI|nr:hypothetical protein FH972_024908 [Carpinus fangiana]